MDEIINFPQIHDVTKYAVAGLDLRGCDSGSYAGSSTKQKQNPKILLRHLIL
jgi:hypothetical protein